MPSPIYKRNGKQWSIQEVLQLQREYELLEWDITKIALKHSRSIDAILFKLDEEGFVNCWNNSKGLRRSPRNT